jgi:AbiV family abortive infection protein
MTSTDEPWLDLLDAALAAGPKLILSAVEFDAACDHVLQLLEDAHLLWSTRSYPSAAFLAITALEETAKVHVGMYRTGSEPAKRGADPLYGHSQKHALAVGPTVAMGSRLPAAIGQERASAVLARAASKELRLVREACLYLERSKDDLQIPGERISREDAKDLLLLAIEAFDDALVGYTAHSMEIGSRADVLFSATAAEHADEAADPAAGTPV